MSKSDGGKGSSPRPMSITEEEYARQWHTIFGRGDVEKMIEDANKYLEQMEEKKDD